MEKREEVFWAARRELYEETEDTTDFLLPVFDIVLENDLYGRVFFAQINRTFPLPASEIDRVVLVNRFLCSWSYPDMEPIIFRVFENK